LSLDRLLDIAHDAGWRVTWHHFRDNVVVNVNRGNGQGNDWKFAPTADEAAAELVAHYHQAPAAEEKTLEPGA
jgi:hypothetical protein